MWYFSILIIFNIILLIWVIVILFPKMTAKSLDVFEYNFDDWCISQFLPRYPKSQKTHCASFVQNGTSFVRLHWISNNDSDRYVCQYYDASSEYVINNNQMFSNDNLWLTIFDKKNGTVAGTARFSTAYIQSLQNYKLFKTVLPFLKTKITSASGILQKYQNGFFVIDLRQKKRRLYLYTSDSAAPPPLIKDLDQFSQKISRKE